MPIITVTQGTVYAPQGLFAVGQSVNVPPADAAHIVSLGVGVLAPGVPQSPGAAFWARGPFQQGSITFSANPVTGSSIVLGGTTVGFVTSGATGNQINLGGNLAATLVTLVAFLNASSDPNISQSVFAASGTVLSVTSDGVFFPITASTSPASNGTTANAGP